MKRFALLAVVAVACMTATLQAQVIGTYRPSLVTYYPSNSSVTPVAYAKPVPTAGTSYVADRYSSYPVTAASATQVISSTPVVQTAYASGTNYVYPTSYANTAGYSYANYPTTAGSPIIGGNCGCAPIQTIGTTSYYPATTVTPVAYQQPIAYQQPVGVPAQTIAGSNPMLGGKYYVGRGLLGRPKVYAHGQPLRNVFRKILP